MITTDAKGDRRKNVTNKKEGGPRRGRPRVLRESRASFL